MMQSYWKLLHDNPPMMKTTNSINQVSNPVVISHDQIVIAKLSKTKSIASEFLSYNISSNEWSHLAKISGTCFYENIITFDKHNNCIYYVYQDVTNTLYALQLGAFYIHTKQLHHLGCFHSIHSRTVGAGYAVIGHNKLHIVLGLGHNKHNVYDIEQQKDKEIFQFNEYDSSLCDFGLIYIENKQKVWLLGGYNLQRSLRNGHSMDDIHTYSIKNNEWKKLDLKLPKPLESFGYILTRNQRYIVTFGGNLGCNDIYIIDTETLMIRAANIQCPEGNTFYACLVQDVKESDLTVTGYINECWMKMKWNETVRYPSYDIVMLIQSFYCIDYVHLMSRNYPFKHWKIDVMRIMD